VTALTPNLQTDCKNVPAVTNRTNPGFSLVELLVVLAIVAALSALIGIGIAQAINKANQRDCLTNMIEIEAAKDEYQRDHPSDTAIPSQTAFAPYFRFGIPRCPNNRSSDYQNLLDLHKPVNCAVHPQNQAFLSPSPSS
jgi:prepilin-type N-terminal cleavage/methylation domain-containing protein